MRRLGRSGRGRRGRLAAARVLGRPRAPLVALALIVALSFGARAFHLGSPCRQPCTKATDHTLIFDEAFYVNAARVIAGIHPPRGAPYHDAPLGKDPNAEHPQLAKLVMAGGIELFGDGPWAWRLGSIVFGLIAIVAMYALVRGVRGPPWLAVGAAGVMALDNLLLVHGRIATLDIYTVALMLVSAALYVRGRRIPAGVVMGVAACTKLVGAYLVAVVVLLELGRALLAWRRDGTRLRSALAGGAVPAALFTAAGAATLLLGLWILDLAVPAYDPGTHVTYGGSPFTHLAHMWDYALSLRTTPDSTGISSSPWAWLLNEKPIDYARVAVNSLQDNRIIASRAVDAFRGEMNPFAIFVLIPALAAGVAAWWRRRDEAALLGVAWFAGTFLPFVVESDLSHRITYLYYMVIVMPAVYLLGAQLFSPRRVGAAATIGWTIALVYGLAHLSPPGALSG